MVVPPPALETLASGSGPTGVDLSQPATIAMIAATRANRFGANAITPPIRGRNVGLADVSFGSRGDLGVQGDAGEARRGGGREPEAGSFVTRQPVSNSTKTGECQPGRRETGNAQRSIARFPARRASRVLRALCKGWLRHTRRWNAFSNIRRGNPTPWRRNGKRFPFVVSCISNRRRPGRRDTNW